MLMTSFVFTSVSLFQGPWSSSLLCPHAEEHGFVHWCSPVPQIQRSSLVFPHAKDQGCLHWYPNVIVIVVFTGVSSWLGHRHLHWCVFMPRIWIVFTCVSSCQGPWLSSLVCPFAKDHICLYWCVLMLRTMVVFTGVSFWQGPLLSSQVFPFTLSLEYGITL